MLYRGGASIHMLEGRIRLKVGKAKGNPRAAADIQRRLSECPGIRQVMTSTLTGSVLILYHSQRLSQNEVLSLLQRLGYLKTAFRAPVATVSGQSYCGALSDMVIRSTMEIAIQRLLLALI